MRQLGPVRLVIFDPITAYCGAGDGTGLGIVHTMLAPLLELAASYGAAVIGTTHLRPGSGHKAIYRAAGHPALITAARSIWGIVHDPRDRARRLMVPVKMNLAPDIDGLQFSIGREGRICWSNEPSRLTADRAIESDHDSSRVAEAARWLKAVLADGSQPARAVLQQAAECGFTASTVQRAREGLGIVVQRTGFGANSRMTWSLNAAPVGEFDFCAGI